MGALEEAAGKTTDALLLQGPIGILALIGWMCVVGLCIVVLAVVRALRASEAARMKDLLDDKAAYERERAEQERKMDILQAVVEAKR